MNKEQGHRIEWIDELKGALLLLICLGHFGYLPKIIILMVAPSGAVYVPCFFFISGLLFNFAKHTTFRAYFQHKGSTLFLPYLFLSFLFLLLDWNLYLHPSAYFKEDVLSIIMGRGPFKASPLWFVITLFFNNILFYLINWWTKKGFFIIVILIGFSILGYILHAASIHLIGNLDVVCSSMLFFGIGHILKGSIQRHTSVVNKYVIGVLLLLCVSLVASKLTGLYEKEAVLGLNQIPNLPLFFLESFVGITVSILVAILAHQYLSSIPLFRPLFQALQYISKEALIILSTHCYLLIVFRAVLLALPMQIGLNYLFLVELILLALTTYLFVTPLFNQKLYLLLGKHQPSKLYIEA